MALGYLVSKRKMKRYKEVGIPKSIMERRPHPLHPNLEVQRNGLVYDVRLNRERKFWRQDQHAYIVFKPKTGKQTYYQVARFVYEAFHGLLTDEQQVYFVDGNSDDRSLTNLVPMTAEDRKVQLIADLENELGGRRHPTLKDYVGIPDGRVYSLVRERYLEGYVKTSGYVRYGKLEGHKIIYECFNGLVNGKTHQVDHINNVHDDNRLVNLQKLTHREHLAKTMTVDNPLAAKKVGVTLSKALIRIRKDKNGNKLEEVFFENVQQAIIETMKQFPDIKIMTADSLTPRTNTNETYKGFFWKFQDPVDFPSEVWKAVPLVDVDLRVSNAGRVEFKNKRRTFGTSAGQSKYLVIEHKGKPYPVHFLICATFHEHPTSLDDKSITPDHINHQVDDNRADNLRWATKAEQVLYRRCMKIIIALDRRNNEEVGFYKTIDEARTAFGVGRNAVIRSLNGTTLYSKSVPNIRFEWKDKNDDNLVGNS